MKVTFNDRLRYKFDNLMSKGAVVLVGILFLATSAVIVGAGLILTLFSADDTSLVAYIWSSIMHVIDAGTITGAATDNLVFLAIMSIVTLCGIFVTSILIGIITTGFEEKLNNLRKGNSRVIEKDHVVILGFDSNVYTLISELITANENRTDGCIVILSEDDKETVEEAIAGAIDDFKTTRVICRTGSITDKNMLSKCSLETCRSIIVNESEDFMTVKTIIAINSYFSSINKSEDLPHIVATINKAKNMDAVNIISNGNAELVLIENAISRIIAQSCRQPGLSNVLMELFDYDGDDLYFENFPELDGVSFGAALNYFEKAVVFGLKRGDDINLNPPKDIILQKDDALILLVEDDGVAKTKAHSVNDLEQYRTKENKEDAPENILIIGVNSMLDIIVKELDSYYEAGSKIIVASSSFENAPNYADIGLKNVSIESVECDIDDREVLEGLTARGVNHILLLSNYDDDDQTADALSLFRLIHIRDIAKKDNLKFSLTSEMRDVTNQRLADVAQVNDLVVGSNIINLILTQICENRDLSTVFGEILGAHGSEIYIRNASKYVKLGVEMSFYEVTEILKESNAIAIGYKRQTEKSFEIITNPSKSDKIIFTETDSIISLCSD